METSTKTKTRSFEDWLGTLSEAARAVSEDKMTIEKAMTLSRITDSAMKVITTAVNVAQLRTPPAVLSRLIGLSGPAANDDDRTEMQSAMRRELALVAEELGKNNLSANRKAFLSEKCRDLKNKLADIE